MALPPVVVASGFLIAVAVSLAIMAYVAWKGSQPSDFFAEAVQSTYGLQISEAEVDAYYDLKEKMMRQYAPELLGQDDDASAAAATAEGGCWTHRATAEERQTLRTALVQRLVSNIEKLDQVQRDKPGNWKLWRGKLVSERYWNSICDAEKIVSEEIDACVQEAEEIEPGWKDHVLSQAVSYWRMQKQHEDEKKAAKKQVEQQKKEKEREVRKKEVEEKKAAEDVLRQERLAEKAMEQLLKEEERESKKTKGAKAKATCKAPTSGSKKKS